MANGIPEFNEARQKRLAEALQNPDDPGNKVIIQKAHERGWITKEEPEKTTQGIIAHPGLFAKGIIRGAERSVVDIVPGALEKIEAVSKFPIVRGAEIAGSLAQRIRGEPRAPFTTLGEMVKEQEAVTKGIEKAVPGTEKGAEIGALLGSGAGLIKGAVKGIARKISERGLPAAQKATLRLERELFQKGAKLRSAKELKAATKVVKERKKTERLVRQIMAEDNSRVLDAIRENPEEIRALVKEGQLGVDDLAVRVSDNLTQIEQGLGKKVGEFRKAALSNRTPSIDAKDVLKTVAEVRDLTQVRGKSLLSGAERRNFELIEALLDPTIQVTPEVGLVGITGVHERALLSPRDALRIVDAIDQMTNAKTVANGNISQDAASALFKIRASIKNKLRAGNEEWANADDLFSQFKEASFNLVRRFSGDQRESAVNNLFGKGKTPTRKRLADALDLAEKLDPAQAGKAKRFFNELANIKAAQGIQAVMVPKADPIADRLNRVVRRWMTGTGTALGTIGAAAGQRAAGFPGAVLGGGVGTSLGLQLGRVLGARAGDPQRVLNSAIRAKELGKEAKALAGDLSFIAKEFGPEGVTAFMRIIEGIEALPAASELARWFHQSTVSPAISPLGLAGSMRAFGGKQ